MPGTTTRAPVTEAELRAAWAALHIQQWPADFAATMQDPIRARLVRIYATHKANTRATCKAWPLSTRSTALRRAVDCKRAAAGDRDE